MTSYTLPKLYKKTNTGAIQQWEIFVSLGNKITTVFGQVDGKLQTVEDTVKAGKNIGKKNQRSAYEQCVFEAKARWTKQKKKGYVESLNDAKSGKVDEIIEGGMLPMLAKVYEDYYEDIKYPVAVQPKLDGHRCIAMIDGRGVASLWTRTRKRYTSVPHIETRLSYVAQKMKWRDVILDGELYNHELKSDFDKISSMVRQKEPHKDCSEIIQYHIYDMVASQCFKTRIARLSDIIIFGGAAVHLVDTQFCRDEDSVSKHYDRYKSLGYEGAMIRQLGIGYENKRSTQLLKMKGFLDDDFEILGVEEGRGKLQGHAGAFICQTPDGKEFNVKMSGDTAKLKLYWEDARSYHKKKLTVKFQDYTKDGIPRFPVGMRLVDK